MMRPPDKPEDTKNLPQSYPQSFKEYEARYKNLVYICSSYLSRTLQPEDYKVKTNLAKNALQALVEEAEYSLTARYFVLKYALPHGNHNRSKDFIKIEVKSSLIAKWKSDLLSYLNIGSIDPIRLLCFVMIKPYEMAAGLFLAYLWGFNSQSILWGGNSESGVLPEIIIELNRYEDWARLEKHKAHRELSLSLSLIKGEDRQHPQVREVRIYALLKDFMDKYIKNLSTKAVIQEKLKGWLDAYNRGFEPQNPAPPLLPPVNVPVLPSRLSLFNNSSSPVMEQGPETSEIQTLEYEVKILEAKMDTIKDALEAVKRTLQTKKDAQAKKQQELSPFPK